MTSKRNGTQRGATGTPDTLCVSLGHQTKRPGPATCQIPDPVRLLGLEATRWLSAAETRRAAYDVPRT